MSSLGTAAWQDIRTFPADLALSIRNEGARGAWKTFAGRSLHRMLRWGRALLFAELLSGCPWFDAPPGITIRPAVVSDVPALARMVGQKEARRLGRLITRGERGLIAWRGQQAVGQVWWTRELSPDVVVWPFPLQLPPDSAYFWNIYVLPRERRHGVARALHCAAVRDAVEAGVRHGWRMIAVSNTASLNLQRSTSTEVRAICEVRFIQLFTRAYVRLISTPLSQEVPCSCLTR